MRRCAFLPLLLLTLVLLPSARAVEPPGVAVEPTRGVPFMRVYPYEEIGYASRSARLGFDHHGRVTVVRDGAFVVLNDEVWLNLANDQSAGVITVRADAAGAMYFGARGQWGRLGESADGRIAREPPAPERMPEWTRAANFDEIIFAGDCVYWGSSNGTVSLNTKDGTTRFHPVRAQSLLIAVGDRVYAATFLGQVFEVSHPTGPELPENPVFWTRSLLLQTPLAGRGALVANDWNQLQVFDGSALHPWGPAASATNGGRISSLCALPDGRIAVAELDHGLLIFDREGRLVTSYKSQRFRQIKSLATHEAGVLWMMTEEGVIKMLYDSPVENFGHELGLSPRWPGVAEHLGKTYVASDGQLFTLQPSSEASESSYLPLPIQPPGGAYKLASVGSALLIGSPSGVVSYQNGNYTSACKFPGMTNFVVVSPDLFFAVSDDEIGAFERVNGGWLPAAPRIAGVGYSPLAHPIRNGVWLEMANRGTARVTLKRDGSGLQLEPVQLWPDAPWTSVSVFQDRVMLTGLPGQRAFFNQTLGEWIQDEALGAALDAPGTWIVRVVEGQNGTLWGSTVQGVIPFFRDGNRLGFNQQKYDFVNDLYPWVSVMPSGAVWVMANQSLYRIDAQPKPDAHISGRPTIVSVYDAASNLELWTADARRRGVLELPPGGSGITLMLFNGTYQHRRPTPYSYRINGERWIAVESGSTLSLHELPEGTHRVEIGFAGQAGPATKPTAFVLVVPTPWYRESLALVVWSVLGALGLVVALRISNRVARRRSEQLERLVSERTQQLESAMERLNEETRAAATLAERNRLAGEIHDSLQQGLSGTILQLESTMNLPQLDDVTRDRLEVVRNMISFTRHEVQNAVWDKESQLLGNHDFGESLQRLTSFINTDSERIGVVIRGEAVPLPTETKHHLMRIAQEATTNALRHGEASSITVELEYLPEELRLSIADNGRGFDPETALTSDQGHFGLRGIQSRARRLQAKLEILSAPSKGTRIQVTLALSSPSSPSA